MTTPNSSSSGDASILLDTIWKLLEQGNNSFDSRDYWDAAECFHDAQQKLRGLSERATTETKIAKLYQEQAKEYFIKGREAVIHALQRQLEQSKGNDEFPPPLFEPDDQGRNRLRLFAQLYASNDLVKEFANAGSSDTTPEQQLSEASLEQRLAQLNQNIPKNLQSNEQRMQQFNRGLNRLGLTSLYDNSRLAAADKLEELPKSEDDQVAAIIAQAKEEVAIMQSTETATTDVIGPPPSALQNAEPENLDGDIDDDINDVSSVDSDSNFSSLSDETVKELSPEQLESIRDKVASAQAQLSQLLVQLQPDAAGYTDIDFDYNSSGKQALQEARRLLCQSVNEWESKKNGRQQAKSK